MNNEYISAVLIGRNWHFTAPGRLKPGTRSNSLRWWSNKRAALAAGSREFPHLKVVK